MDTYHHLRRAEGSPSKKTRIWRKIRQKLATIFMILAFLFAIHAIYIIGKVLYHAVSL